MDGGPVRVADRVRRQAGHCGTAVASLVLGDDHVLFLDALSSVLTQRGYAVAAVAASADEMVDSVRDERPDACLIDRSSLRHEDGDVIRRLLAVSSRTSILVLSADHRAATARRALAAGASAYVHQSRGVNALVGALERVLAGTVVVDSPASPAVRIPPPKVTWRADRPAVFTGSARPLRPATVCPVRWKE
jgi:two-component system nitrate/nitrite response regulator NarL